MADFARSTHPGVQAQLDRLEKLSPAGDRLGLERIAAVLDRLGRPQDRLPPVFHVAGTNGKGSTLAFLRAALEASGHSVHAFTSPHLVRFNERIRVAGRLIDDERLASLLCCYSVLRTGNLWFAVGIHVAYDFMQLFVIGTPNGGHFPVGHLLDASFNGPAWLTGGPLGTEASWLAYPLDALAFAYLWWRFRRNPDFEPQ
jgi:hypothetical protein